MPRRARARCAGRCGPAAGRTSASSSPRRGRREFALSAATARGSRSTKTARRAPRDSASIPARPCPRRGRGPCLPAARASRTAPPGRGRSSGAWRPDGAEQAPAEAPGDDPHVSPPRLRLEVRERAGQQARAPDARGRGRRPAAPAPGCARRAARRPQAAAPKRNRASPDCRVPVSPSPRSSRSISARRKPSECSASAFIRADSLAEQQAQRRVLAPPARPRSWWSLGDAVALGVLHDDHARVGDVDADLDDRGGDEHVGLPAAKTPSRPPCRARSGARGSGSRGSP